MKIDFHGHNASTSKADHFIYCHADLTQELPGNLENSKICFGLHPWFLPNSWEEGVALLENWKKHPQFFSLGECGLDRAKGPHWDEQIDFFQRQLEWASQYNLPFIVIHSVRANPECWGLIKKSSFKGKVVFHDYKDHSDFTDQLLRTERVYFSLGTALDGKGQFLKTKSTLPVDSFLKKVFLETDDCHLTIHKRYQQLAEEFSLKEALLEEQILSNLEELSH